MKFLKLIFTLSLTFLFFQVSAIRTDTIKKTIHQRMIKKEKKENKREISQEREPQNNKDDSNKNKKDMYKKGPIHKL